MSLRCPHCPPACHILYILTEDSSAMYALVARTAPVILATQRGFMAVVGGLGGEIEVSRAPTVLSSAQLSRHSSWHVCCSEGHEQNARMPQGAG